MNNMSCDCLVQTKAGENLPSILLPVKDLEIHYTYNEAGKLATKWVTYQNVVYTKTYTYDEEDVLTDESQWEGAEIGGDYLMTEDLNYLMTEDLNYLVTESVPIT